GSFSMACVIVPAAAKDVRSCGIRAVFLLTTCWLGNGTLAPGWPIWNGVMSTGLMLGLPLTVEKVPWASMVVPWGIDPMRKTVGCGTLGSVVFGMDIQSPGSKWMPTRCAGMVTSWITCR